MKTPFEKELKNKLLIKTIGNQSEEMILLRAFKYFDLSNTNFCDKQNFIKTVMKIGITGFTENNLSSIFESYDTENAGKINYKDFIGNLYNNPSIMDNPEKLKPRKKKQDYPYAPSESSHKDEHLSHKDKQRLAQLLQELFVDNDVVLFILRLSSVLFLLSSVFLIKETLCISLFVLVLFLLGILLVFILS